MRILLINQYAGAPSLGMEYRPHWMATEWQKLGHEVLIVAGDHSHLRRVQPSAGRSTVEGVDFLTLRTPQYDENGPRRFANILAFRVQLRRAAKTLREWRPDVVIASSTHPMDIRPGLRIARKSGALFVHEVHDLWPLTPKLLGGMSDRHPMIMWMQREEDLACREADLVVSMLPATLPYLESRGLDADRWVYVSNGVPVEAVLDTDDPPGTMAVFRVGYFGAHGPANDLGTLIEAARLLQDDLVEFHLTGSGPLKAELQRQASGLANVHLSRPGGAGGSSAGDAHHGCPGHGCSATRDSTTTGSASTRCSTTWSLGDPSFKLSRPPTARHNRLAVPSCVALGIRKTWHAPSRL